MPSIENKKVIVNKIVKDLAQIHDEVFSCHIDDFNQHGDFTVIVNITNIGKRPNLTSISRRIRNYLDKHPNVSLYGKKVTGPKAIYANKRPWVSDKRHFVSYVTNDIEVDFTIVEDEEKVNIRDLLICKR
ncbi:hypothetical protein KBA63_04140 [Candidatus Woesebacteria bacterium]|nr:hypothetical protein [Candidatus Woesebacteria bacterium]